MIIPVENTKQIPGKRWLAVQATTDEAAAAALKAIAERAGLTLGGPVYVWGPPPSYYYAALEAAQPAEAESSRDPAKVE